jgi:NitT/TauT family transport system substrate-binding protein
MRVVRSRRAVGFLLVMLMGLTLAACGGDSDDPPAAQPGGQTTPSFSGPPDDVTIQLTFRIRGGLASLATAQHKGYFKEQNINAEFVEGTGSLAVMSAVPDGKNVFVFGPDTAAAQAISQGIPLVTVATYQTATPIGLVARPGVKLTTPKDLEGLRLALVTGDTFSRIWPAFAEKNGVDASKVRSTTMDGAARTNSLIHGDVDVASVLLDNELPLVASQLRGTLPTLRIADFGFPLLGDGVTVRKSLVEQKPDLVRRFLAALQKGYNANQTTPGLGAESTLALWADKMPAKEIATAQVEATLAADKQGKAPNQPYGYVPASAWDNTLSILQSVGGITNRLPTDQYFTNAYLPEPPK